MWRLWVYERMSGLWRTILSLMLSGHLAQLVEHPLEAREAVGSIPTMPTLAL